MAETEGMGGAPVGGGPDPIGPGPARRGGGAAFRRKNAWLALFCLLPVLALFPSFAGAQTELGVGDDLTALGVDGTADDPDVEIKGFIVVGSTRSSYPGAEIGPGNMVVNGRLAVSSGAYFAGASTFGATLDMAGHAIVNVGTITLANAIVLYTAGTAGRPASPSAGTVMFNTDSHKPEIFNGTKWMTIMTIDSSFRASGGEEFVQDGYKYHTLAAGQSLTVLGTSNADVELLIVAGGGGGGWNEPGGGGSGGCIVRSTITLSPGVYPAMIGNGGACGVSGANSSFLDFVAIGGGYGGTYDSIPAAAGGSGGGGFAGDFNNGGAGTPGQGYRGGGNYGGGGGCGGPGSDSYGAGGAGIEWPTASGSYYGIGGNYSYSVAAEGTGNGGQRGGAGSSGTVKIRYPWGE